MEWFETLLILPVDQEDPDLFNLLVGDFLDDKALIIHFEILSHLGDLA